MLATLFFFFFGVFVFVDDSTSPLLLLTNFMNSYVTHNFPPNVIGFINALSVKLSANATVNRVGSAFANIGILLTAERAGPLELSSITHKHRLHVLFNRLDVCERLADCFGRLDSVRGDPRGRREGDGEDFVESVPREDAREGRESAQKSARQYTSSFRSLKRAPNITVVRTSALLSRQRRTREKENNNNKKKRRTKRTRTPKVRLWPLTLGLRSVA